MEEHYDFGELYVEFIHGNCASKQGELCAHCVQKGWSRPPMNDPIPRPMPNEETLPNYHYKSVLDTPAKAEDGKPRKIDDFQPRANICSQFAEGKLKDLTSITTFSTKFIVEESLVKDYLEHLQNLDLQKQVCT